MASKFTVYKYRENWGEIVSERGDYEDLLPKFAVYKYG